MKTPMITTLAGAALVSLTAMNATASEPESCQSVGLANVNWTGVTIKSEMMGYLLDTLGYETNLTTASVPIAFQSVADGQRDAFLGLWLPTQKSMIASYLEDGEIDQLSANLEGAKYTLAVPEYVWEAGVRDFSDLDDHKERFEGRIYGIEAGNDGNAAIQSMIDDDAFGLGDWELMSSSEAGMLTQVQRSVPREEWVTFLGWAPHPMNINIDMRYLTGGAEYFGPDQGGATVYTITTAGYTDRCTNVGRLLEQYAYTVEEQSKAGGHVINDDMSPLEAAQSVVSDNPALLDRWLDGVTTASGDGDAVEVIRDDLGL
ncbi:choline ABC transporter substrate-binding protein [Spiribacter vilamensis]|uniref:Glycine betaine/proline transport system substrate-binding protein n=1 Tax=Spiribacter vilamensis TaxID=531306 RepID=A0A4Q8D2P8_9GAMM|nr:choline ABC transporter substrate-binding protein [Spiribacter vilamensis]RZU99676.1 glycine betaine/proline transport system substrate-binding protein [Spiribacter vilamensis]TVO61372.1 choline ABC transporter substrate-binding protein [Spiribacter vilamensis]